MSVETEIREYLNQYLLFSDDAFEYDDDDSFLENGIVDSGAVMVTHLFNAMSGLEITPDNFDSVNKLARYVRSRLNGSAAA